MQRQLRARRVIRRQRRQIWAWLMRLGFVQGALGGMILGYGHCGHVPWLALCGLIGLEGLRQGLMWASHLHVLQRTTWVGLMAGSVCVIPLAFVMDGFLSVHSAPGSPAWQFGLMLAVGACLGSWQATQALRAGWLPVGGGLVLGFGSALYEDIARFGGRVPSLVVAFSGLWLAQTARAQYARKTDQMRRLRPNPDPEQRTLRLD